MTHGILPRQLEDTNDWIRKASSSSQKSFNLLIWDKILRNISYLSFFLSVPVVHFEEESRESKQMKNIITWNSKNGNVFQNRQYGSQNNGMSTDFVPTIHLAERLARHFPHWYDLLKSCLLQGFRTPRLCWQLRSLLQILLSPVLPFTALVHLELLAFLSSNLHLHVYFSLRPRTPATICRSYLVQKALAEDLG